MLIEKTNTEGEFYVWLTISPSDAHNMHYNTEQEVTIMNDDGSSIMLQGDCGDLNVDLPHGQEYVIPIGRLKIDPDDQKNVSNKAYRISDLNIIKVEST